MLGIFFCFGGPRIIFEYVTNENRYMDRWMDAWHAWRMCGCEVENPHGGKIQNTQYTECCVCSAVIILRITVFLDGEMIGDGRWTTCVFQ